MKLDFLVPGKNLPMNILDLWFHCNYMYEFTWFLENFHPSNFLRFEISRE